MRPKNTRLRMSQKKRQPTGKTVENPYYRSIGTVVGELSTYTKAWSLRSKGLILVCSCSSCSSAYLAKSLNHFLVSCGTSGKISKTKAWNETSKRSMTSVCRILATWPLQSMRVVTLLTLHVHAIDFLDT